MSAESSIFLFTMPFKCAVILIVAGGYEIFNPDNCPRNRVFILVFYLFPFNHFQVITLVFSTNVLAKSRLFLANRS